ncbi:hypothetical protein RKE29_02345 [Streptomyces sp. B1866]|uniref:hypothetical protein n=1 Tax=Streptomyces sp. B1866 TaxID=3075431 RepID=UPI00288EF2B1|nr:hypothetical protein [Streptomyces sp. B1866]MDT3395497.1 hypothetical protein [Streptomyces sp. B1866]
MALRLFRGKDGRLTAYAAVPGGTHRWTENRPGGPDWTGPLHTDTPGLAAVTTAQGADGYLHLVGLRFRHDGSRTLTDVLHATQFQTGRPCTAWHALGTPRPPKDSPAARRTGPPAAAVDGEGRPHLFVRNADGGVSVRWQDTKGTWKDWTDLKGEGVVGGLAAAAMPDGRVEVFAAAGDRVLHWQQPKPAAAFEPDDDIPARPQQDSLSAVAVGGETVTCYWRDADGGGLRAWRPGAEPASLGGETGTGPVAAARVEIDGFACTVLAHADAKTGRIAVAAHPAEDESAGVWWTPTGDPGAREPALALDGTGRVVLAALGPGGELRVTRQKTDESGLALRAWVRV